MHYMMELLLCSTHGYTLELNFGTASHIIHGFEVSCIATCWHMDLFLESVPYHCYHTIAHITVSYDGAILLMRLSPPFLHVLWIMVMIRGWLLYGSNQFIPFWRRFIGDLPYFIGWIDLLLETCTCGLEHLFLYCIFI